MARGKKFNVFMEHVTIDYPTLMKYRNILDEYIKKHDLWDVNTRECWLFDLIDFKLSHIDDEAYEKQVKTYKQYMQKLCPDKKINMYILGILSLDKKEVKDD